MTSFQIFNFVVESGNFVQKFKRLSDKIFVFHCFVEYKNSPSTKEVKFCVWAYNTHVCPRRNQYDPTIHAHVNSLG
jgi:hypothetical protein